jgi:hypothetical protein
MRSTTRFPVTGWRQTAPAGLAMVLLAGALLAACQSQVLAVVPTAVAVPSAAAAADKGDVLAATLLSRLRAEIGAARCDNDTQCRTVAVGERACGGPEAWLAWSATDSDAARLAALSAESVTQARQRNAQSGMASNCRYNADPGAQCVAGVCRLRSPNLAI